MHQVDDNFIRKLFSGKYIFAVIGASNNPAKYGFKIYKQLKDINIKVYPVNPHEELIQGDKCFENIFQLPKDVDVLNFVVPPEISLKVTKNAINKGFKIFWYQPGSYNSEVLALHDNLNTKVIAGQCVLLESMKISSK